MSVELLDALSKEILALKEQVAFLESREVCAAAHENVEACGYCQRDKLAAALKEMLDNALADGWKHSNCNYKVDAVREATDVLHSCGSGPPETKVKDPEKSDWIARCPRCCSLPRPTLMGRTVCDKCGGLDVAQPLDPGLPKETWPVSLKDGPTTVYGSEKETP